MTSSTRDVGELDVRRTLDAVWKLESARIIAALTRVVHDVGRAEELAQDALVSALEHWPEAGVPDNPGAWLMTAAKRRAIDDIRRAQRLERKQEQLAYELRQQELEQEPERGDVLRLMFLSCHPVLPQPARVALTLRLVAGLTNEEIARAFLVPEAQIVQRIAGAKKKLADEQVPFELPAGSGLADRLSSVLGVIYLIFNEGYTATSGDDLIRPDLCVEALRLGRMLAELTPDESEVHGLVALMEIQASRSAARTGPSGEPIPLEEQNRGRWDPLLIRRGFAAMLRARDIGGTPGPYLLQGAIAVCHAQARTAEDTDWAQIATLYDALSRLLPTPVVHLNRAVAVGRAHGPAEGLALVDSVVDDPQLRDYHLVPSVRGDLLFRLGRGEEARLEFERGAALARNATERAYLRRRADEIPIAEPAGRTLGQAAHDFLCRDDLDAATVRSYGQTLRRLCLALGEQAPLASVTAERVARLFETAWARTAAKTWNRHRSAIRSFSVWAGLNDLAAGLDRRAETDPRPVPIGSPQLEELWRRTDLALRERTLWCLLYESGAPVKTVLSLNVEDLDLADRRARAGAQGVSWRSASARLLSELVAGRARGPLFITDRLPGPGRQPVDADRCPETGRRRLSYERAEYLFKQATKSVDPAGHGYTLRQLKEPRR